MTNSGVILHTLIVGLSIARACQSIAIFSRCLLGADAKFFLLKENYVVSNLTYSDVLHWSLFCVIYKCLSMLLYCHASGRAGPTDVEPAGPWGKELHGVLAQGTTARGFAVNIEVKTRDFMDIMLLTMLNHA